MSKTMDMNKMKMKEKLVFGYALEIGLMIILTIVAVVGLSFVNSKMNSYLNGAQTADTAVKTCRISANIGGRIIREMALNEDTDTYSDYEEQIQTQIANLNENLTILKNTNVLEDDLYQSYEDAITNWITIGNSIVDKLKAGDREAAIKAIHEECSPALSEAVAIATEIDLITDEEKEHAISMNKKTLIFDVILMLLVLGIAVAVSFKIGKKVIDSVVLPLKEIENAAIEMSRGNLHTEVVYHSEDELGKVAHALRSSINTLWSYVEDIDRAMKEFAQGNFDVKANVKYKGDFIGIEESFMHFEANMADVVKNIQAVANQVTSASEQISSTSTDLAEGASEQAGITQQVAATIETVSGQIERNAEDAASISKEVQQVGVEIDKSNGKMQEMVRSMNRISESSNEISKIIATINDIASQTNLLALNASIEAARAGEAGKGFAVVADQVSVLAAQSAEAAKESTKLIGESVQAVEGGMVIANETANQLESVVTASKDIIVKVNQIAEASDAQAESVNQINTGVEHINDVVQTNSATSQECAAASQEMSAQAETLRDLIRQLKVGKF